MSAVHGQHNAPLRRRLPPRAARGLGQFSEMRDAALENFTPPPDMRTREALRPYAVH